MKKILLSLALVATALTFTSCGDDEPIIQDEPIKETIVGKNLISSVVTIAQNKATYIETADYTFNIEGTKNDAKMSIVATDVKFDSHMPVKVSFRLEGIKAIYFDNNTIMFNAAKVKMYKTTGEEYSGYEITNVQGYIDSKNGVYSLEYVVNGTWRIIVCNTTIRTCVTNYDYTAPTELYYTYQIDITTMKAEVFIYNVQFQVDNDMSPVLKKISIPGLDVTATATGLELTGDNIVPTYYTGANLDQATPYPALIVTNFKSTLNLLNGEHTIFFNCHGGEHQVRNLLYINLWDSNVNN